MAIIKKTTEAIAPIAAFQSTESLADSVAASIEEMVNYEFEARDESLDFDLDTDSFNAVDSNLPIVQITKIILEPTGGDIIPENNPHIDDVEGANILVDEFGNVEFVSKGIDYLTKTTTPAGLLVKVQITLREILDSSGVGTWYDNPEFLKYLKIRVVESHKTSLFQEFIAGKYDITPESYKESKFKKYANEVIISVENEILSDINQYTSYKDSQGNRVYDIRFEASFYHTKSNPEHLSYFAHAFLDSEQIAADFGCGTGNLEAAELKTKHGPTTGELVVNSSKVSKNSFVYYTPQNKVWLGPVHFHEGVGFMAGIEHTDKPHPVLRRVVVQNTKIQDLRDSLDFERAEIEFSIIENKLLNLSLSTLERSVVDVKKTQEYFSELYGTRDAEGRFRGTIAVNFQKILRDNAEFGKLLTNKNLSVVEEISNSCKILMAKIVRQRVENIESLNMLGNIIHGRVPFGTSELGLITHSEPIKTVVYSSSGARKTLSPYTRRITSTGQAVEKTEKNKIIRAGLEDAGFLTEVNVFPNLDGNVRHFAFTDHDIAKTTDGVYRYGIELTVEDGTRDYLLGISRRLLNAKKQLETYYNEAISSTAGQRNYNSKNEKYTRTFTNFKNSQYPATKDNKIRGETKVVYLGATKEKAPRNVKNHKHSFLVDSVGTGQTSVVDNHFHMVSGFKIGEAIDTKTKKKIPGSHTHATNVINSRSMAPWVNPIAEYLEILDIFSAGNHSVDINKLSKMLHKMLSTETGNPESILRLVKLIDDLYYKVDTVTGAPISISGRSSSRRSGARKRTIKLDKMFDEIFDSNVPKHTGYDYLMMQEQNPTEQGLYMVDGKTYVSRAKQETRKYFCEDQSAELVVSHGGKAYIQNDMISNTELAFLCPATAQIAGKTAFNMLGDCDFEKQSLTLMELESKILLYNAEPEKISLIGAASQAPSLSVTTIQDNTKTLFSKMNVVVADITEKSITGFSALFPTTVQRRIENVKTYLGKENLMVRQDLNVENLTKGDLGSVPANFELSIAENNNNVLNIISSPIKNNVNNPFVKNENPFKTNISADIETTAGLQIEKFDISNSYNVLESIDSAQFQAFPNQFKSLFVQNSPIVNLLERASTEPTQRAEIESVLRLNLQLLKSVEVFAGYQLKEDGSVLIKAPQWTSLTYDLYNESVGQILLCRLKNYSNSEINASYREVLDMPTYNEYFFLKPTEQEITKTTRSSPFSFNTYRRSLNSGKVKITEQVRKDIGTETISSERISSNIFIREQFGFKKRSSVKSSDSETVETQNTSRRRTRRRRSSMNNRGSGDTY